MQKSSFFGIVPKGNRALVTFKNIYYVPKNRSFVIIDEHSKFSYFGVDELRLKEITPEYKNEIGV